ncbi:putative glutathione transferase [Helianthus annuus]|nr:putative glutathione transferase [Helianthus annuus]
MTFLSVYIDPNLHWGLRHDRWQRSIAYFILFFNSKIYLLYIYHPLSPIFFIKKLLLSLLLLLYFIQSCIHSDPLLVSGVLARPMNPNTTQPQQTFNLQEMDPSMLTYAAYLNGATPFVPPTFGYGQAGGSQPSQQQAESETDVDVVPETQPEPVQEKSKRGRRSHKKKEKDEPRRTKTTIKWTKEEEFTLTRAWLDISEDHETPNFQTGLVFWDRVRALFFSTWGQGEHRDKDSISSKLTDINNKCHAFQEVYQRNYDTRPSGESDVGVLTKTLDEFEKTKCPFPYYKCWDLLRKSPKWALVNPMTSSSRRRAKRSKTSSSVDPETPTSDARNVDLMRWWTLTGNFKKS